MSLDRITEAAEATHKFELYIDTTQKWRPLIFRPKAYVSKNMRQRVNHKGLSWEFPVEDQKLEKAHNNLSDRFIEIS